MPGMKERLGVLRERHPHVDHAVRMQEHFGATNAGQQAGAITYFAFLSFFPVLALAFFAVGVLSRVVDGADDALRAAITSLFPGIIGDGENELQLRDFRNFSGLAGVIGLAGVLYSGLGWISALREGLEAVFDVPRGEQPGFVAGKLRDLAVLVLTGVTLLVSVGVSGVVARYSKAILGWFELDQELAWLVSLLTVGLGLLANGVLFLTMFRLLGGRDTPLRALVSGALLGTVLFEVLKQAAGLVIASAQGQPAFQAFGIALTVLVWINYFSRLILYAASWAWTSPLARETRAAAAAAEPVAPVQGPALPSGDDAVVPPGSAPTTSRAKPFAAGAAAALGVVAATRRKKEDS